MKIIIILLCQVCGIISICTINFQNKDDLLVVDQTFNNGTSKRTF